MFGPTLPESTKNDEEVDDDNDDEFRWQINHAIFKGLFQLIFDTYSYYSTLKICTLIGLNKSHDLILSLCQSRVIL